MNTTITNNGFLPLTIDHINFDRDAITDGLNAVAQALNANYSKFIINGCSLSPDGSDVVLSAGNIFSSGEIFTVDEQTIPNKTVAQVEAMYFDLYETYDTNSQKTYLSGDVFETRKIRKAILVNSPSTFTNSQYKILPRLKIDSVDADLQLHKSKGEDHNYLPNHFEDGNMNELSITNQTASINLVTGDSRWYCSYYIVGNIVFLSFSIVITPSVSTFDNTLFTFELDSPFPLSLGHAHISLAPVANVNNFSGLTNGNPVANMVAVVNSSRTNSTNYLLISPATDTDELTGLSGNYVLLGSMTLKKISTQSGV